ncbi:MAG: amino acid adenylation domain-containing protein, partial [Psychrosphaera sp.]|nr:amino acid adenylation domain-containing protein [Psychrosphaera sp.]
MVGTPSDNRHHGQTQSLIGYFVNSLALRADVQSQNTLQDLIAQVHQVVIQAKIHEDLPFEKVVDALQQSRDTARHPIFQVSFALESFWGLAQQDIKLPFKPVDWDAEQHLHSASQFDLSLVFTDDQAQLSGGFKYALSLFEPATIARISTIYQRVLEAFVADTSQPIGQINLLDDSQTQQLLTQWNPTETPYPQSQTIHGLFEAQAQKTPNHIALSTCNTTKTENGQTLTYQQLSYQQLNTKANALAQQLTANFVVLYMDRSIDMVVAMLAVLKAGGAYVPISPKHPKARVQFMFKDIKAPIVLTQNHYRETLADWLGEMDKTPTIMTTETVEHETAEQATDNLTLIDAHDLAYVIYTSGTTGQPKGVMIEHQSVVSLVQNNHFIDYQKEDVILHLSDPNFDAATFEIWGALTNGLTLAIAPAEQNLAAQSLEALLLGRVKSPKVTVLWLTRALFDNLFHQQPDMFASLRYLLIGGEQLTPSVMAKLVAQSQRPEFILNGYGPTESTTFTTIHQLAHCDRCPDKSVPIGKPINTRKVYVLSAQGKPVPIGAPGELYIGGAGLARGYLNQPELTAAKFVDNPFGEGKLYKSGDRVRFLADGTLEYLGRLDS